MSFKYSILNKARHSKFPMNTVLYAALITVLVLSTFFILCMIIASAVTMMNFNGKN